MASNAKVAVVTGSSSGIGLATALALARKGYFTYATVRNPGKAGTVTEAAKGLPIAVVQLDVTDDESVRRAVAQILKEKGRIDLLVNNAGYGLGGSFEDSSMEEIKDQYETNVFWLMRTTQAVLPAMRKQRSGTIVNISSAAGRIGYPGASVYISTKHAIEGLSEAMAYELDPFGIRVIVVEPGVIKTNFGAGMVIAKKAQDPSSPYSQMMQKMGSNWQHMVESGSPAELVANAVIDSIESKDGGLRYVAGKDVEGWIQSRNGIPEAEFFKRMKQNLLGA